MGGDLCLGCVGGFDVGEKYGDKNTTPAEGGVFLLPPPTYISMSIMDRLGSVFYLLLPGAGQGR